MTPEEHKIRHVELHQALDELVADWIFHVEGALPSMRMVLDLMQWSYQQTQSPTEGGRF